MQTEQMAQCDGMFAWVLLSGCIGREEVEHRLIQTGEQSLGQGGTDECRDHAFGRRTQVVVALLREALIVLLEGKGAVAHDQQSMKPREIPFNVGLHLRQLDWIHSQLLRRCLPPILRRPVLAWH
ncbi:MAG TPA: hypothetical protein VF026_25535 [Ktedonobacteraceae bacterium]